MNVQQTAFWILFCNSKIFTGHLEARAPEFYPGYSLLDGTEDSSKKITPVTVIRLTAEFNGLDDAIIMKGARWNDSGTKSLIYVP